MVCIACGKSDPFSARLGFCQGYPLSPVLFLIFTDSVKFDGLRFPSKLFVDDLVLFKYLGVLFRS